MPIGEADTRKPVLEFPRSATVKDGRSIAVDIDLAEFSTRSITTC